MEKVSENLEKIVHFLCIGLLAQFCFISQVNYIVLYSLI